MRTIDPTVACTIKPQRLVIQRWMKRDGAMESQDGRRMAQRKSRNSTSSFGICLYVQREWIVVGTIRCGCVGTFCYLRYRPPGTALRATVAETETSTSCATKRQRLAWLQKGRRCACQSHSCGKHGLAWTAWRCKPTDAGRDRAPRQW